MCVCVHTRACTRETVARVALKNQAKQEETKFQASGGLREGANSSGCSTGLENLLEMPPYQKQEMDGHLTHSTWRPTSGFSKELHVEWLLQNDGPCQASII